MKRFHKLESSKMAFYLFLLCWLAYFTSYIGRLNFSSAMTAMIEEQVLAGSQAGFISMVYFFAYGIGQMCNGLLGDRFHPGHMIFTGLAAAAAANLIMGFVDSFFLMSLVWGINGYAQSMIWPPIIRIFAEMLQEMQKVRYCIHIVSSQVAGTLGAYLLAAAVMWLAGWKAVFGAAALCLGVMAAVWSLGFGRIERYSQSCGKEDTAAPDASGLKPQDTSKAVPFSSLLFSSGLLAVKPGNSPLDSFLFPASHIGRRRFACYLANAPIGSQAGSMVAGSSKAFWYSAGSMLFGTATS